MRALFVRIYLAVAAVVCCALLLSLAWGEARRGPPRWSALSAPSVVREALATRPEAEAIAHLRDELDVDVDVTDTRRLPPDLREALARGETIFPAPGSPPDLILPLDAGRAIVLRPDHAPPALLMPAAAALMLAGLGAAVGLQLLPLQRDLESLALAADRLGRGELQARARLRDRSALSAIGARFDEMAGRVEGAMNARRELLLAVSHELRHPLHRLRFSADLLVDASGEEREGLAEGVQRDLDELEHLVAELLDWGRLDVLGEPSREPVALRPLLEEIASSFGRLGKPIAVSAADITIAADRALLSRALGNLVANAVRHARTRVEISASEGRIDVDDDGPGIPPHERERVFEPFVRLTEARTLDSGSVGLGLAIAERIARAHGFTIAVAEAPIGGARVSLRGLG